MDHSSVRVAVGSHGTWEDDSPAGIQGSSPAWDLEQHGELWTGFDEHGPVLL